MTVNTLGSNEQDRSSRTVAEWLWPFLPMGISAFSLSALIWYHLRRDVFERDIHSALQVMYANLYKLIGFAPSVLFFLLTLTWSSIWFATGKVDRPLGRLGRLLAMTVMIGILINLGHGGVAPEVHKGELGAWLAEHLYNSFGYLPSLLVVWAVTFASMLLATDFFFSDSFERLRTARPAAPTELGVEPAVTDHLRGLATAPVPLVVPTLPSAAERPAAVGTDLLAAAAVAEDATATPAASETGDGQLPIDEPPPEPRRRSYAERRRDRERRWEQEEWVPPAPENQEIENPEASLRAAGLTEPAAIVDSAPESAATAETAADNTATDNTATVNTAAFVTEASAAAPATVGATPVLDGETDLVDIEELEDFVGGEEEEAVADDDDDDDDADEVDAEATDGDREDSTAPVEIERPTVIAAVEVPTPVAESTTVAQPEVGLDAFARDGERTAGDDRGASVDADEDDDAEQLEDENPVDGARDDDDEDVRQFDEIEDVDEVEDDLEVVAEAGTGDAGRPQPAPGDEPVVSIPRPDPSGGWSPVFWQPQRQPEQPAAQAAEPPVEIPSREAPREAEVPSAREAEVPSAREATDERAAGRQQQLFGSWLDEGLIQDAIEVVTTTRRANAALLQRKLRIDYALAIDVLGALAARGVVELEGDSTQGRVLV